MQNLINVWSGLDLRKRVILVLSAVAMAFTLLAISRIVSSPNMTLLYAGLDANSAGDVLQALEQRKSQYEVRGGSIYVSSSERDELRLILAGEGLPATGEKGYELLDSLSGFGTTSQMFDAAYWRAKEGELARTIVASPFVKQARVHIANNGSNPFQRNVPPSASVSVVPVGVPITPAQANALRYLVASAVSGLSVDNVAIIDANGALIGPNESTQGPNTGDERAQLLRDRVLRLVEARVGAGNAVVEVSVDTVTETESIRERRFDPEGRVAISTDTEERTDSSENAANGNVTVASNLPDGDAAQGDGSKAQASETRERINYEVSETEHEILRTPGAVKRLTVAVLINGIAGTDGAAGFQQRPQEELDALRDLVASAVGFQEERGDVITLKSMDLPAVEPLGTAAGTSLFQQLNLDAMSLVQIGILSVVTLILGLFVLRPILTKPPALKPASPSALPGLSDELPDFSNGPALTGEIEDGNFAGMQQFDMDGTNDFPSMPSFGTASADPVDRLRSMIGERQEETVEILRSWLEESGERT